MPKKDTSYRKFYWAVGTLYLEDLIEIYDAIDNAIGELKAKRADDLAWWEDRKKDHIKHAEEWPEIVREAEEAGIPMSPMVEANLTPREDFEIPEYLFAPLINLQNEEHEFDSLDEVAGIHRRHFREFEFRVGHPYYFYVVVDPPYARVSVDKITEATETAVLRIDRRLRERQYRVSDFLNGWRVLSLWTALGVVFFALVFVIDLPMWFIVLYVVLAWSYACLALLPPVLLWLRKRAVVPKFRSDAETWWDKHGLQTVVGILGAVATIVAAILA